MRLQSRQFIFLVFLLELLSANGALADNAITWKDVPPYHFSKTYWRMHYTNRIKDFAGLLNDFDLIGMPRSKLTELLGASHEPGETTYSIQSTCTGGQIVRFEFLNDVVTRWRFESWSTFNKEQQIDPWVTENVVFSLTPEIPIQFNPKL
jgi:hypothetical protein